MSVILARRYARAFMEIGVAQRALPALRADMEALAAAVTACAELLPVWRDEEIPLAQRLRLVDALAPRLTLKPVTVHFLKVLLEQRRIGDLLAIIAAYWQCVAEREGIVTAEVATAIPMPDPALARAAAAVVAQRTQRTARVQSRTEPQLLGGVAVRVGDEVYDGSIAAELRRMKDQLLHD